MGIFHGKDMWRSPWASHGIAWGVGSWMCGSHGNLPWQGHVEVTMGIPWNCMGGGLLDVWKPWESSMARTCGGHHGHPMELHGGWAPGCVEAMGIFHGKDMWRSPWASHGIAWGVGSWMCGSHGNLPWQGHVEVTMGIPWN